MAHRELTVVAVLCRNNPPLTGEFQFLVAGDEPLVSADGIDSDGDFRIDPECLADDAEENEEVAFGKMSNNLKPNL